VEAQTGYLAHTKVERTPLNIAVVIDRSGSMAGEKMESAKKAAALIVDQLAPMDFISVVMYDEFIDVVQEATPAAHKDSIKMKIARIKPRGSTNLWGGCERGYEQVQKNYRKDYVNRVLLISDGNITAGVKIPARIIESVKAYKDVSGITLSTFGVGLDYNENLMTDMAENGAGNYYFINETEKMAGIFDRELKGLQNIIAQEADLAITIPKGVTVENVFPLKAGLQKDELLVRLRELSSEERKAMVVQFRVDNNWEKELVFRTRLSYTDAVSRQPVHITTENRLAPEKDPGVYFASFNKPVAEQVVLFSTNENLEKAMHEIDRGNFEAARRHADANTGYFRASAAYVKGSVELQRMDSLNRVYAAGLQQARTMTRDSLKLVQKTNKAANYQIRSKKQ
jgi:Ca-activated chloride channel family protein